MGIFKSGTSNQRSKNKRFRRNRDINLKERKGGMGEFPGQGGPVAREAVTTSRANNNEPSSIHHESASVGNLEEENGRPPNRIGLKQKGGFALRRF